MSDEAVHKIMTLLWSPEGMETMVTASKSFNEMNLDNAFMGASVPLHPGAVKFWKEHGKEIPENLMP